MNANYPNAIRQALVDLGRTIATARKARGMSQADLAQRLGVSKVTVIRLESGHPGTKVGTVFHALWLVDLPLWPSLDVDTAEQLRLLQRKADLVGARGGRRRVISDAF